MTFRAAIVQDSPVFLDKAATVEKTCALIELAAGLGASLIAFPETWIPGYPVWLDCAPGAGLWDHPPAKQVFRMLFENSIVLPGPETTVIGEVVQRLGVTVVLSAHERVGGTLYNTLFTIGPSGVVEQIHRKVMPTYTERMIWGMGDGSTLGVYDSPVGTVGGLICWEHWMPALRIVMHEQRELVHVAQWPWVKEMNLVACRQYAFEGGCFVLAAGAILRRNDLPAVPLLDEIPSGPELLLRGGSAILAPDGSFLAGPLMNEPGILVAEIDPALAIEARLALDTAGHYSRPDLFRLSVDRAPKRNVE